MTIYELTLLFNIHARADSFEHHPNSLGRDEALVRLFNRELIDALAQPKVTDKGRCFIESVLATPLPTCVWKGANGVEVSA